MNMAFMAELLSSVSECSLRLVGLSPKRKAEISRADLMTPARDLVSHRGEASGVVIAREILTRYETLRRDGRIAFLAGLVEGFGHDDARLAKAVERWRAKPGPITVGELHRASEPRRHELLCRLNLAPGGTAALVRLREDLIDFVKDEPQLTALDADLVHLFTSWFNRGFLVVRRIDWSSPANILETLIRYEAVHDIGGWDDLRRRIEPEDRLC